MNERTEWERSVLGRFLELAPAEHGDVLPDFINVLTRAMLEVRKEPGWYPRTDWCICAVPHEGARMLGAPRVCESCWCPIYAPIQLTEVEFLNDETREGLVTHITAWVNSGRNR